MNSDTQTSTETEQKLRDLMADVGKQARSAAFRLANATTDQKRNALTTSANEMRQRVDKILESNLLDLKNAHERGLSGAMIDRLKLDASRIESIAAGLKSISKLDDPIGETIKRWDRPNGLEISRVRTPLGVIGVIYESRPNVTADAGGLCLMSGNAVILRGGSDSTYSSKAIYDCLAVGLKAAELPASSIQLVPTTDRAAVGEMLKGLGGSIDVIVPRGGKNLVSRVQQDCRVPVFAHLEGICHVYVDASAGLAMANDIVLNAQMRRTGICGAAETLLVDRAAAKSHLPSIAKSLRDAGCELRCDEECFDLVEGCIEATEADWATEYLDAILSIKIVDGIGGCIDHLQKYSSGHTESIVSENEPDVERFFAEVDSAILLHNASTQFADGGEFGMGAEIGIATGKMHARGPVGVEQLTSFKYLVRGSGQIRPA